MYVRVEKTVKPRGNFDYNIFQFGQIKGYNYILRILF